MHDLASNFIVGSKEEAKKALLLLLEMSNPLMKEIDSRLQMLNVLSSRNERTSRNSISSNEIFLSIVDISCTPPLHGFVYLPISRKNQFKTF